MRPSLERSALALSILSGLYCCTSLDGVSGGTDQPDAANDASDSSVTDTSVVDAGDASTDDAGLLDGASPCSTAHTFCDDFDREGGVQGSWSGMTIPLPTSSMKIVTDSVVSAPNSLLVTLESDAGSLFLNRDLGAATKSIHIELDLNLNQTTTGPEVDLVQLRWLTPPAPCTSLGYYLVRDRTGPLVLQETYTGCGGNANPSLGNPAGWHHYTLDVTLGVMGHVKLRIDNDLPVVDKDVRELPPAPIELRLGAGGEALKGQWRVRYDNVLVDVK